jgi:hypothetical protein
MAIKPISFRPSQYDQEVIEKSGQSPTDAIRQALRLLDREYWLAQLRVDVESQGSFDPNVEAEAW